MTKIGVGVGEDFPIEDKPEGAGSQGAAGEQGYDPAYDHGGCGWHGRDRHEWREQRRAWRRQRHEWRRQHREWRRRFRHEMRARGYSGFGFFPWVPLAIAAFVLASLITGVITIIASAPVVVLGLLLLAVLYAAHRFHHPFGSDVRVYVSDPRDGQQGTQSPREEN